MKTLLSLIFAASAFAAPVAVGTISTTLACFGTPPSEVCYLQPTIKNDTNVTFGSGNLMVQVNATFVVGGQTMGTSYYMPRTVNGIAPGSTFQVPLQIPAGATSWSISVVTSLRPPLSKLDMWGKTTYFGVTSFLVGTQWYVAQNTYVSGTANSANGVLNCSDAIPGWMAPSGLGGILPGPPA